MMWRVRGVLCLAVLTSSLWLGCQSNDSGSKDDAKDVAPRLSVRESQKAGSEHSSRRFTCDDMNEFLTMTKSALDTTEITSKSKHMVGWVATITGSCTRHGPNDAGNMLMLFFDYARSVNGQQCDGGKIFVVMDFCFPNDQATRSRLSRIDWAKDVTVSGTLGEVWHFSDLGGYPGSYLAFVGDVGSVANVASQTTQ